MDGLRIAILGAESTGKTWLAQALAERLAVLTGWRCTWVPEWLRQWCHVHGRTPRADEQRAIAEQQQALIDQAAATHDLVVCDTTPLMTAVYSRQLFADRSLEPYAVAQQRRCALSLLTALDIPWAPDGLQRDGPQVRTPVDDLLRELLLAHGLPWAGVRGEGSARLGAAVDAVAPMLARERPARARHSSGLAAAAAPGLFQHLLDRQAALPPGSTAPWQCLNCDDPDCEHRLAAQQRRAGG